MMTTRRNGEVWADTEGRPIHAHGGHMLRENGYWYWYGENRTGSNYVSCYRSSDLMNWEFRRNSLTTESPMTPLRQRTTLRLSTDGGGKVNLERPKVLRNPRTGQYVMWMHYENGTDYLDAACAIATCDTPDGDFVYHGHFNPFGFMSRDCTLYADPDGTAFFLSASRDNADLHVYRLQDDYLNVDALVHRLWPGEYREAPAVMARNGQYYLLSSYCTGWHPNQGRYATAASIEGRWSSLHDFGDETTFRTQPAFILPIEGQQATTFLYVADRWDAEAYHQSGYVFLPLCFRQDGSLYLEDVAAFGIDAAAGVYMPYMETGY